MRLLAGGTRFFREQDVTAESGPSTSSSKVARIVALAVVYAAAAKLGLMMDAVSGFATLVWPPTGIALAALLLGGYQLWPGVAIGAFVANAWSGAPLVVALGIAVGNTLEAAVGAAALRRFGFRPELDRLRDVVNLVLLAALGSTLISATVGCISLTLGGTTPVSKLALTFMAWWMGDLTSDLIVAPLLLVWIATRGRPAGRGRPLEALALCASIVFAGLVVFREFLTRPLGEWEIYPLFPLLIWAALRFEQHGTTFATLIVSVLSIWGTARGTGPFVRNALHQSLIQLQGFTDVVAITLLLLGAAVAEREQARALALAALRSRDEFLSIASHELRTPLSALVLSLESSRRAMDRADLTETDRRLGRAARQTDRLTALVDRLLDVSRIRAGRLQIRAEPMDLVQVVRDVVERYTVDARSRGTDVIVDAPERAEGRWDKLRVEQIVTNLLTNAFRYGEGKPVTIVVTLSDDAVELSVSDQGFGVPVDSIPTIFDRFERGERSNEHGGLGLGLYITRQLVEAHGGSISVTSTSGSGSTFRVVLPLAIDAVEPVAPEREADGAAKAS